MKKYNNMVTFYHDIEQDLDSDADPKICIKIIDEFLQLEKKYNISSTYNIVGSLFNKFPELINKIKRDGHDISFHSYTHNTDWTADIYAQEIEMCRNSDDKIIGYRSPRSLWNETTLHALWKYGFLWNAEYDNKSEPYFIYKNIVRLPIATDDWGIHVNDIKTEDWINKFSELLDSRKYFGFGTHDFTFSKDPQRYLEAYEKVIQIASEKNVLICNFSQVADLFRRTCLSEFYTDISKNWNKDTRVLYRTKRFQELIRAEAEELKKPVVADLGSGGGVLSVQLQDIASKIYCVDNSNGMLTDLTPDHKIEPILGEVTNTNISSDSVDFIICARVLEYITSPDHVANEIKRIGKLGGKFLVTVPAYLDDGPSNEGGVPDKLRKHFKAEEISSWANQIGSGELIGVHYFQGEPENEKDEVRYRIIEKKQPKDLIPTNWVFIGTIENKQNAYFNYSTIPLHYFYFNKF